MWIVSWLLEKKEESYWIYLQQAERKHKHDKNTVKIKNMQACVT